jgi:hypothetical protein
MKPQKESSIQKQIAIYLSTIAADKGLLFFSIPNESLSTALRMFSIPKDTAAKLSMHFKKMGLLPGIPDMCILWNGKAIFVEVKKPGERPREDQERIHRLIKKTGHSVWTVFQWEDIKGVLTQEGVVL